MMPAYSPFVALRYLLKRRINVLGVSGVAFAVWAMLVVNGVFTGFVQDIRRDVRQSACDLLVTDLPVETAYAPIATAVAAAGGAEVLATAPRLRHHGLLQPVRVPRAERVHKSSQVDFDHTENGFALLLGIDPLAEPKVSGLQRWLERAPAAFGRHGIDRPGATVLQEPDRERRRALLLPDAIEWQARRRAGLPVEPEAGQHRSSWPGVLLGWRRIRATPWLTEGDPLDLLCVSFPLRDGQPHLRTHSLRAAFAGWFSTGSRMFDETTALVPIETLRTLLGHDESDPLSVDIVTDVAVAVRPNMPPGQLTALKAKIGAAVQACLPGGSPACAVLDWEEQNSVFLSAVAHEQAMMQFVLFVVMLVAAFVIYATLHMMVVQKVKDIGILAALGGSPRGIGAVFLLSGAVVAVTGTALGMAAGAVSLAWLNPFNDWLYEHTQVELFPRSLFDLREIPVHLDPRWIAAVATGAIASALLVALVPARKAARLPPVTALSYE